MPYNNFQSFQRKDTGEFLRLCGEFLRRTGEFLRLCGEFLRRNGEFLRRALCKGMISNTYSAPESRRILNLLERGGTIKIVLAVFPFRKRTSYTFCVQQMHPPSGTLG